MRLIDADALTRRIYGEERPEIYDGAEEIEWIEKCMNDAPTITPDDVRGVGEWEDAQQHGLVRCSVCKDCYIERDYIAQAKWRYCPNCGARMKGAEDGTTD